MEWFYSHESATTDEDDDFVLIDEQGVPVPAAAEASYLMHQALHGNLDCIATAADKEDGQQAVVDDVHQKPPVYEQIEVEDEWAQVDDFGLDREKLSAMYFLDEVTKEEDTVQLSAAGSDKAKQPAVETAADDDEPFSRVGTEDEEWTLESIVQRRFDRDAGEHVYLCQWKWYREPTWELRSLLEEEGYGKVLEQFDEGKRQSGNKGQKPSRGPTESGTKAVKSMFDLMPNLVSQVETCAKQYGMHLVQFAPVDNPMLHRRFVQRWNQFPHTNLKLLFHGTRLRNFASIERSGLIVPGRGGIRVAHGSAYGVGVYTAKNPQYSQSYGEHCCMFVCLGLVGHRYTTVSEVGNSICVFFDETLVVPVLAVQFKHGVQESGAEARDSLREFLCCVDERHYYKQEFPQVSVTGATPAAVLDSVVPEAKKKGMTKKMLKQAPKSIKELYKMGLLRQRRQN